MSSVLGRVRSEQDLTPCSPWPLTLSLFYRSEIILIQVGGTIRENNMLERMRRFSALLIAACFFCGAVYVNSSPSIVAEDECVAKKGVHPGDVGAAEVEAVCYLKKKNYSEAIKILDGVIEINSEFPLAHQARGEARLKMRQFEEAVADLKLAINEDSRGLKNYILLSSAYIGLGDFKGLRNH